MLTIMLFLIPVLQAGMLVAVNFLPNKRLGGTLLGLVLLAMVSNIQLNIGYENVRVDITVFVLLIVNLSLSVHLMLKNKLQTLETDRISGTRFRLAAGSIAFMLLMLLFQGYTLEIYEAGLYVYHLNLLLNLLQMALLFYLLGMLQIHASTLLLCIVCYSVANSVLGLLQYATNKSLLLFSAQDSINYYEGVKVAKRVVGFVGASNGAGNLGAILFPVLLYYFMQRKSLFAFTAMLLNAAFLFLTFTRIGYLSVCVQFLIFLFFAPLGNRYGLMKKIGMIIAAGLAAVIAYQLFFDQLYQILFLDRGDTESHRFMQFTGAFSVLREHLWFGLGAGQYIPYMQTHHGIDDIALHSQFLNALVEQGIFGFMMFFFAFGALFVWSLKKYKGEGWFPVALFLGYFIVANFNPNQYYSLCTYTFFAIAFVLVFARKSPDMRQSAKQNVQMEPSNCPKPNRQVVNIMQMYKGI
ncbi:O-antigen ligase family protein [Paenibacillus azoreducens]|uniref:O-antigen ligase-related domain-containing protein n=1 Tax=Paenibacillus azoreducens TaxID=116718 RepID=A0A920CU48_9BACL|nr:O-antigen ligase family protein [Paenibacillus azoreducens]GIO49108.1 hypothetical protein J34TS1_38730 [Paenibacillus azoreducens]